MMTQIDNKFESTNRLVHMICYALSHAPTMLKSDWSVFENAPYRKIKGYITCLAGKYHDLSNK